MTAGPQLASHPVFDPGILRGFHLLESDAGTGKTWTIAGLVVRALLERELDIDRILVVTFTNAATAELAARIRERIATMLRLLEDHLAGEESGVDELFCREYLPRIADPAHALGRLRIALSRIDEASVRTIHGFCQRVIDEYGLTTGLPGGIEVGPGDSGWIDALVADWWRRHVVPAAPAQLALLVDCGVGPDRVRELVHAIQANPAAQRATPACDWRELADRLASLRARLAAALDAEEQPLLDWLRTPGNVKAGKFGTNHVPGRLGKVRHWCAAGACGEELASKTRRDLVNAAQRLSAERLSEALVTDSPPSFAIPGLCGELAGLLPQCDSVAAQLAEEIWSASAAQRLERRNGGVPLGFDELLSIVHDALLDPASGEELAQALRERYPLALVDECQDTDSLQWEIFRRIHLDAPGEACGLVLVGDPKQAIYAFRGADVYSYLDARSNGPREHALRENQRSVSGLVEAVNALFEPGRPFGVDGIAFAPALTGAKRRRVLRGPGGKSVDDGFAPLTVLRFGADAPGGDESGGDESGEDESGDDAPGRAMTVEQASRVAVAITVTEIRRLLGAGLRLDERPLEPADLAVLVDSHRHATRVKRALAAVGIGAVEISRDSVVASAEAADLMRWLAAIADPADTGLVRSALVSTLAGFDARSLEALSAEPRRWNDWVERFAACRDEWQRSGAQAALRRLLFATGVPARLAGLSDGERRLTNLLHLIELLADADEAVQGPRQAWRWFARQRAAESRAAREALELRLDSDENLVRILTVHKSKGLEFPFVFLPFAWHGRRPQTGTPFVHHTGPDSRSGHTARWQPVLELAEDPPAGATQQRLHEIRAESVRRLYVALTRAEQRCYVLWGPVKSTPDSPLGQLLAARAEVDEGAAEAEGRRDDPAMLAAAIGRWREAAPAGTVALVQRAAEVDVGRPAAPGASGHAEADATRSPPISEARPFGEARPLCEARPFGVAVPQPWIRTSFSAIVARAGGHVASPDTATAAAGEAEPRPDHDQFELATALVDAGAPAEAEGAPPARAPHAAQLPLPFDLDRPDARDVRFDFPAGARAGGCLHAILEHAALEAPIDRGLVAEQLLRAGYADIEAAPVAVWLDEVLDAPLLGPDGRPVWLRALRPAAVVREMDFHLAARGVDDRELLDAVGSEYPLDLRAARSHWDGFLRGFIDMVFEHDGRWYVLDWKSNRLGNGPEAFGPPAIDAAMGANAYSLQACLYLLVLHRLLRQRLPGYDWQRHVGGAFWVFLRGVRRPGKAGRFTPGVHASKPSRALIDRLDRLFGGGAQ